jgi:hypothetical protein
LAGVGVWIKTLHKKMSRGRSKGAGPTEIVSAISIVLLSTNSRGHIKTKLSGGANIFWGWSGMCRNGATYEIFIKLSGLLSKWFAIVPSVGIAPWHFSL